MKYLLKNKPHEIADAFIVEGRNSSTEPIKFILFVKLKHDKTYWHSGCMDTLIEAIDMYGESFDSIFETPNKPDWQLEEYRVIDFGYLPKRIIYNLDWIGFWLCCGISFGLGFLFPELLGWIFS